jgi:hypothetical protein
MLSESASRARKPARHSPTCRYILYCSVLPCTACLYRRAIELYDQDISFLSNRAAVHFEMGHFAACIDDCDKGERVGLSGWVSD